MGLYAIDVKSELRLIEDPSSEYESDEEEKSDRVRMEVPKLKKERV